MFVLSSCIFYSLVSQNKVINTLSEKYGLPFKNLYFETNQGKVRDLLTDIVRFYKGKWDPSVDEYMPETFNWEHGDYFLGYRFSYDQFYDVAIFFKIPSKIRGTKINDYKDIHTIKLDATANYLVLLSFDLKRKWEKL